MGSGLVLIAVFVGGVNVNLIRAFCSNVFSVYGRPVGIPLQHPLPFSVLALRLVPKPGFKQQPEVLVLQDNVLRSDRVQAQCCCPSLGGRTARGQTPSLATRATPEPHGSMAPGACLRSPWVTGLPEATALIHRTALLGYIGTALISVCLAEEDNQGTCFCSGGCGMAGHCCSLQGTVPGAGCSPRPPARGDTAGLDPHSALGLSHYCNIQLHKPAQPLARSIVGQEGSSCFKTSAKGLACAAACSPASRGSGSSRAAALRLPLPLSKGLRDVV